MRQTTNSLVTRVILVGVCVLSLSGGAGNIELGPDAVKGKTVDGTVDMTEVQAAYIGSGATGNGVLSFRGKNYPFDVGGVGIGGIGLSTVDATGEVYNSATPPSFPALMGRPVMALRSARRAPAICGCRTRLA